MSAFRIFSRFAELLDINVTRAAVAWLRLNADGTVSERTAAQTRTDLGVGTGDSPTFVAVLAGTSIFETLVDPSNPGVNATFISPPANSGRIYLGKSGRAAYSLNLSNVSQIEGAPSWGSGSMNFGGTSGTTMGILRKSGLNAITHHASGTSSYHVFSVNASGFTTTELERFRISDTAITATVPLVQKPSASATPPTNGDLMFEATSNTSLTVKLKGTDGTVRSVVLTLAP